MGQTKETMSIKQRTNRHRMHIHGTQPAGPVQGIVLTRWQHMGMLGYQLDTRRVTLAGIVPFFQVHLHITIDNIHGKEETFGEQCE